jgi:sn-glycerol 3-phosphate transport system substrate-binding protein
MAEPSRRSTVEATRCAALVVVLVVGCGCTGGDDDRSDAPPDAARRGGGTQLASCDGPPAGRPVEITFVHSEQNNPVLRVDREDSIAGYVADFEAANPGIDVEVVPEPDGSDALLSRWRRQSPDKRPEVVLLPQAASGRLIDSGQTVAPGGCSREVAADMLPAVHGAWSSGGVLQAMPFAVSTPVLLSNRALFRAAGLDPDRPLKTLDDLRLAALKLVQTGAADTGFLFDTGPEGGAAWMVEQAGARTGQVALDPGNGRHRPATRVAWRSGPALDTLGWLADGLAEGWAESIGRNVNGADDLLQAAAQATPTGMVVHSCGALGEVFELLDGGGYPHVDLGVAPLPRPEGGPRPPGGHGSLPGGSALWIAGGKSEAETAAAWALASYLASPPVQGDWAAETGYVPISPSAARQPPLVERWRQHPEMRVAYDILADQGTTPAELGPLAGPLAEIRELEAEALDRVAGGTDPIAALTAAADDADRLLEAYATSRPDG